MVSEDYKTTLGIIALALIIIPNLISKYKDIQSYGCTIPLLGIMLLLFTIFYIKDIIIIRNNKIVVHNNTIFSSVKFTYHNGRTGEIILTDDKVLINDSDHNLTLESINYGHIYDGVNNEVTKSINIPPSSFSAIKTIDYYFNEPPESIYQKASDSKVKYWLHY